MRKNLIAAFIVFMNSSAHNLIEIQKIVPTIKVDLIFATPQNFTHTPLYPSCARAYLLKPVAEKLSRVQKRLELYGLGLLVIDAYRPHNVQYKLFKQVPDPRYIFDPTQGSNHNRGIAVDVTLINLETNNELPMPTTLESFNRGDYFNETAHRDYMDLSDEVIKNRKFLEKIMAEEGFVGLPTEWWHYHIPELEDSALLDIDFIYLI